MTSHSEKVLKYSVEGFEKKGEFFEASAPAGLVSLHYRRQEDGTEDKCAYFSNV